MFRKKIKEFQDKLHEISKPIKINKSLSPNHNNFNISHNNTNSNNHINKKYSNFTF